MHMDDSVQLIGGASEAQCVSRCMTRSSVYRITELLSRIKYRNRGIFYDITFSVVGQFRPPPRQKKTPDFFETKFL